VSSNFIKGGGRVAGRSPSLILNAMEGEGCGVLVACTGRAHLSEVVQGELCEYQVERALNIGAKDVQKLKGWEKQSRCTRQVWELETEHKKQGSGKCRNLRGLKQSRDPQGESAKGTGRSLQTLIPQAKPGK